MRQRKCFRNLWHNGGQVDRIAVDSTVLVWVRYWPDRRILQVGLRSSAAYEYFDVPDGVYRELLAAESKGRYYNRHIRNAFRFRRVIRRVAD